MHVLDTNVVSELRKARTGRADRRVEAWALSVPPASLYLSVITILELELGVRSMERRDAVQGAALRDWMDHNVLPAFKGRILPLDTDVALRCAALHVPDRMSDHDAIVAATALHYGMIVVTRNTADFVRSGVQLVNPWLASAS